MSTESNVVLLAENKTETESGSYTRTHSSTFWKRHQSVCTIVAVAWNTFNMIKSVWENHVPIISDYYYYYYKRVWL